MPSVSRAGGLGTRRRPPAYPCAVSDTEIELDPAAVVHLDPEDVATAVRVLALAPSLEIDDPDFETLKRAASLMYKRLKKDRRNAKTWAERKADRQVIEATATGSPMRIDDETKGIPLVSNASGAFAGELVNPRGCYICKRDYTLVDAFYHWLCPDCAARSHAKRDQRTDLTGKRALLTGGRAKIGMYIALRLLRDGAHTTITTRFPKDAMRRFASMEDTRRLDPPAQDRRHRPARPHPGRRPRRRGDRRRPARHPRQQRRADGAPLPRRLQQPRRARVGAAP